MKKYILLNLILSIIILNTRAQTTELWGMTTEGGTNDKGVIFKYDRTTNTYTKKLEFNGTNGWHPQGSLMQASNGKLYGMTEVGGTNNAGVLFEFDPTTDTYTKKVEFNGTDGANPFGSLIQASNGKLYGMTYNGGANDVGVLFEYDTATNTYIKKIDFNETNGAHPFGSLTQAANGKLYGMTYNGGDYDNGVIFEFNPASDSFTIKYVFNLSNGANPKGSLIQASNLKLYGMTEDGGVNYAGVLFEYDPIRNTYTKKMDFEWSMLGASPSGSLIQASNGKLYGMTYDGGENYNGVLFEYDPISDTYNNKLDFIGTNGAFPKGSLLETSNGKLYGMTSSGGVNNKGVLFVYDPVTDSYTKKIEFDGTNGQSPTGSLIEIDYSLSIEDQTDLNIKTTPNPTTNFVNISMTEKPIKVSMFNMAGVLIYETNQTSKEMTIDMSNYAKAVYLLKIQTGKGLATYKVIKQ